jgi:hypothetical protein
MLKIIIFLKIFLKYLNKLNSPRISKSKIKYLERQLYNYLKIYINNVKTHLCNVSPRVASQ